MDSLINQLESLLNAINQINVDKIVDAITVEELGVLELHMAKTTALLSQAHTASVRHSRKQQAKSPVLGQVKNAETLATVARATGVNVQDLRNWNPHLGDLAANTALPPDTFLKVPPPKTKTNDTTPKSKEASFHYNSITSDIKENLRSPRYATPDKTKTQTRAAATSPSPAQPPATTATAQVSKQPDSAAQAPSTTAEPASSTAADRLNEPHRLTPLKGGRSASETSSAASAPRRNDGTRGYTKTNSASSGKETTPSPAAETERGSGGNEGPSQPRESSLASNLMSTPPAYAPAPRMSQRYTGASDAKKRPPSELNDVAVAEKEDDSALPQFSIPPEAAAPSQANLPRSGSESLTSPLAKEESNGSRTIIHRTRSGSVSSTTSLHDTLPDKATKTSLPSVQKDASGSLPGVSPPSSASPCLSSERPSRHEPQPTQSPTEQCTTPPRSSTGNRPDGRGEKDVEVSDTSSASGEDEAATPCAEVPSSIGTYVSRPPPTLSSRAEAPLRSPRGGTALAAAGGVKMSAAAAATKKAKKEEVVASKTADPCPHEAATKRTDSPKGALSLRHLESPRSPRAHTTPTLNAPTPSSGGGTTPRQRQQPPPPPPLSASEESAPEKVSPLPVPQEPAPAAAEDKPTSPSSSTARTPSPRVLYTSLSPSASPQAEDKKEVAPNATLVSPGPSAGKASATEGHSPATGTVPSPRPPLSPRKAAGSPLPPPTPPSATDTTQTPTEAAKTPAAERPNAATDATTESEMEDEEDVEDEFDTIRGISATYKVPVDQVLAFNPYLKEYGVDDPLPPDLPIVLPLKQK